MSGLVVVETAVLACTAGASPTALIVTSQETETVDGLAVGTIADCTSVTNVPTFGVCSLLTAAANGVSCPCVPAPAGTWLPGSTNSFIDGVAVLTETDELICSEGGTITVTSPGQASVTVM